MKIGIILEQPAPLPISPIIAEMMQWLEKWGVETTPLFPQIALSNLTQLQPDCDLYVFKKTGRELGLSLGGSLHAIGATLVNPYPVAVMLRDKIVSTRVLQAYDVPVPDTFVAESPAQLEPLLAGGPLVVKPYDGSQGRGVRVVADAAALHDVPLSNGFLFAQRYHPPQGRDHKIYCIGDQMFGVRRVWPAVTHKDKLGEPFTLTPEMHQIAMRCGEAFGISLFGIDIVVSNGHSYVVDMSSFPGFKGVPDAALRLADYIYDLGRQVVNRPAQQPVATPGANHLSPEAPKHD